MFWKINPLVRLAIPFIVGMIGANFLIDFLIGQGRPLFVAVCVLAFLLFILYIGVRRAAQDSLFSLTSMLLVATLGAWLYVEKYEGMEDFELQDGQSIIGVVDRPPVEKNKSWAVEVETDEGRLLAHVAKDSLHSPSVLQRGDSLVLVPRHLRLTSPRLAASDSTASDFLFYYRYLFFKGIGATCYVPAEGWLHTPAAEDSFTWSKAFAGVRQQMHLAYVEAGLEGDAGNVIEAMTTGNRAALSSELRQAYGNAGVAHVLALSGFHLGLLLTVFNLLVQNFCIYRWRRLIAFCFIPMIWVFCLLADMPPSLLRATIMCTIVQLTIIFDRSNNMLNACALAAILMLSFNPLMIQDVGFQLSFLAMVGIAASMPRLFDIDTSSRKIRRFVLNTIRISLACFLVTFPLCAYHFGQIPLLGVLTNLVISILVPLLMFGVLTWWLLYLVGIRWMLLAGGLALLAGWMNCFVSWVASIPFSTVSYRPSPIEVVLLYGLMGSLWCYAYRRTALPLKLFLSFLILFCVVLIAS